MLKRLRLVNFKNFADAELPLGPFTVLVGTNASGKSNLRDALRFLHGISRSYSLAEIFGEKYIEGGVLQWRGIRGGTREVAFRQAPRFSVEVTFSPTAQVVQDAPASGNGKARPEEPGELIYSIDVEVGTPDRAPRVLHERLTRERRDKVLFESVRPSDSAAPSDPAHLGVHIARRARRGRSSQITVPSNRPVLSQLLDHAQEGTTHVAPLALAAMSALGSMRFLELSPDAMRLPSQPGQTVLGDRGENLSSVLQAICANPGRRKALVEWVRELTPVDVSDFEFLEDQTGRILVSLLDDKGQRTSAHSASDGTLRFLGVVAALLGPEPARFYFCEELENGIHPTRLHLLLQLIEQKTSAATVQMVATSHSPVLLGLLGSQARKDAVLVYRRPGRADGRIRRIISLPEAARVLGEQDLARLHASGWLEDAVAFTEPDEREE
jgi:predicted ATPase